MGAINGGLARRLVPRSQFAFGNLAGNQTETFQLVTHLAAGGFTTAEFLVRMHPGTIVGVGGQLQVLVRSDGYDRQDPSTAFLQTLATVTVDNSAVFPLFAIVAVAGFGPFLQVDLAGIQPAAPVVLVAQISLEVVLKGGDPAGYPDLPNTPRGHVSA